MDQNCNICKRIGEFKTLGHPNFVRELETGFVVIGDHQFYEGYCLFLCKLHFEELHELDKEFRKQFLWEMSLVAEAMQIAFQPDKINYELLGNRIKHMHWHIFPRYEKTDPDFHNPVWIIDREIRYSPTIVPDPEKLKTLVKQLDKALLTLL